MSDFAYPLHEECGVFGIYDRAGTEDVAAAAYSALYALQHRGQESCGIAVNDDGVIQGHRDLGLVNEVFTPAVLGSLSTPTAHMATGHVRYATAGQRSRSNAQPMILQGAVDCMFEENGSLYILDFKTDRCYNKQELWERYGPQLTLYKEAMTRVMNKEVNDTVLYSFYMNAPVYAPGKE